LTRKRSANHGIPDKEAPARFDPLTVPLAGINLIEANAGTGKTWAITALYVRLLLEADRAVDSILVVTFTEAATGELRDRIRKRLSDTRDAFERGTAAEDDTVSRALLESATDRNVARLKLVTALRDFDQAPIYTIHAFCQRVLGDRAFDSGMPFRTEIVPDQSAIVREIVEDFWRREMHAASPLFTRYLAAKRVGPDALLSDDVERALGKPYLEIRRPAEMEPVASFERAFEAARAAARSIWLAEREAIGRALNESTGLHAGRYRKALIPDWLEEMHAYLAPELPPLELCKCFEKFTVESLRGATNRGGTTPAHSFFDACEALKEAHARLGDAFGRSLVSLRIQLIDYCNAELASRKEKRRLQSYDDLLLNLARALEGDQGDALAAALRERYDAALIDEFQDTDPLQYDIFRRIYAGTDCPVFLVGDPKQAIYSFRGADVYTYIGARADARAAHTLDVNWRSTAPLLSAVNRIFEHAPNPFAIEEIGFKPSRAAEGNRGRLLIEGDDDAAFRIWLLESEDGKTLNKGAATAMARDATVAEIVRLLDLAAHERARIEEGDGRTRRLCGGDIAVLVRSHRQGAAVREALAKHGVASVQRGSASVFSTREAEELERILAAIAEPGREVLIGAALATETMGYTGEALHALRSDELKWEALVESFREAHREWHEGGFVRMLRAFARRHEVLVRLLEFRDGERRATNLLHLAELLHRDAERHGIGGLLAWLAAKRRAPEEGNEAELLRLESDENLVKILTVHVAKGLEFPLVFCPFVWDGNLRSERSDVIRFHEGGDTRRAVVDFGSPQLDASRSQAVLEEHAENVRLLYVALTRARYRCWMVWGNIKDSPSSAPAWLLHRSAAADEVAAVFGASTVALTNASLRADLERIAATAEGAIEVSVPPVASLARLELAKTSGAQLAARSFDRALHDTRWVASFTSLTQGRTIEAPDYDAGDSEMLSPVEVLEPQPAGRSIFAFPRGAQAGTCLHAIFEQVDFTHLERPAVERIVVKELAAHGFEAAWLRTIADTVSAVVDTPLDESGMTLRNVPRERRLDELEFYYPIAAVSDAGLRRVLLTGGFPAEIRERIGSLTFRPTQGYMRGFIDLVFEHAGRYYLADYKSNWLGATPEAYSQASLARAMGREAYYLQYLVYCVALHRYLGGRIPAYRYESHFGGVRYLFLRGMQRATGACGVYADRPGEALIDALDAYLRDGGA
jgi:exodeoxyribonuclease V beta subunit